MDLDDVSPDTPGVGGKAAGLARVRLAGLAVPPGFVIREGEPELALALALGRGPWIVRSSTELEDHAAPGIFLTVRDVDTSGVADAVRAVRASAASPTALAYLAGRAPPSMAVIVQQQVAGTLGTACSRDPGGQPGVLVESGDHLALVDNAIAGDLDLAPDVLLEIAAAARRLETAFATPVDIEWVAGERLWIVQARRASQTAARPPVVSRDELAAALDFSRRAPGTVWTWDATHNPVPLSPAQAGLVELVEAARAAGVRQRVVLGYLYTTSDGAPSPDRIIEAGDLPRAYREEIAPAFERDLARMGGDLEQTLEAYLFFYRRYSLTLSPSLARAPGVRLDAGALSLAGVAPAWDVAAPTYAERSLGGTARLGRIADLDDVFFARAQAGVRAALAGLATRWGLALEDVTFLPLEELRVGRPADAAARARTARDRHQRLSAFAPPLAITGGLALYRPAAGALRGRGTGGRARGVALKLDALAPAQGRGRVLVAATILPTMAPLLDGAAAIVAEHGGLLGHGAALARELGIPCVVGCQGALAALDDGDEVWVDADAGVVIPLARR